MKKVPVTTGLRHIRKLKITFEPFIFEYVEKGGASLSSSLLGEDSKKVIKTIVIQGQSGNVYIVLMHGDREVSLKSFARHINEKSCALCPSEVAKKHTGYEFGGTSPFGLKRTIPIYGEESIFSLPYIWINGGKRGFLVKIDPQELKSKLEVAMVNAQT